MKKVLAAALLCAVSSFAAWDYFPVIEYGKAEAKVYYSSGRQAYDEGQGLGFKIRYSPMENLELLSQVDMGSNHVIGVRYQIIPVLSAGLDIGTPIPIPAWSFTPNIQFSMPISDALALGSNVAFTIPMENAEYEYTEVMRLDAGVELDLSIGQSTIWISFDVGTGIGEDSEKNKAKDLGQGLSLSPAIGYVASVGNISVGTFVAFDFGEDAGNDPFVTTIGIDAAVKF
ncbi:MAG: hypothetical protein FWC26_08450 [Fibromonadales bacterium]|nr:hypothetical protein [Fibromonadales bacterium]